jgi:hypothetical protein
MGHFRSKGMNLELLKSLTIEENVMVESRYTYETENISLGGFKFKNIP